MLFEMRRIDVRLLVLLSQMLLQLLLALIANDRQQNRHDTALHQHQNVFGRAFGQRTQHDGGIDAHGQRYIDGGQEADETRHNALRNNAALLLVAANDGVLEADEGFVIAFDVLVVQLIDVGPRVFHVLFVCAVRKDCSCCVI